MGGAFTEFRSVRFGSVRFEFEFEFLPKVSPTLKSVEAAHWV